MGTPLTVDMGLGGYVVHQDEDKIIYVLVSAGIPSWNSLLHLPEPEPGGLVKKGGSRRRFDSW